MSAKQDKASDNIEFYSKLFQALEFDKKKQEGVVIRHLFHSFSFPGNEDPITWFASHHSAEDIMGWLMREIEPFTQMLSQLYEWLADIRATAGGTVDHVTFDFAGLDAKVPFSLTAFPKTHLSAWADRRVLGRTFDPGARGHLRVDTPNYWRDDVHALSNLSYSPVLRSYQFDSLPEPNKRVVIRCVQYIVDVLEQHYVHKTVPEDIDVWQLRNHPVLYVRSEGLWEETLRLAGRPGADGGTAANRAASDLYGFLQQGIRTGEMVHGQEFLECLQHGAEYLKGTESATGNAPVLNQEDLDSDHTYAFLCAFDCCFPAHETVVRSLTDVIDKVLLPFWRHRWRLFEVWAILWLRRVLPEDRRPVPCLTKSPDLQNTYEWFLPGGDAKAPVATIDTGDSILEIWFQLKTPLNPNDATKFGQKNIEPDLRLIRRHFGERQDLAILELKDRHEARGSEEKRIARMYSSTGAAVVCIANYSFFTAKSLHHKVYTERVGSSDIFIVDDFKPNKTPEEVQHAILRTIEVGLDILLDVSGSMNRHQVSAVLDDLCQLGLGFDRWFAWANELSEFSNQQETEAAELGAGTELQAAVTEYKRLNATLKHRAVVLTDHQGAQQFFALKQQDIVDEDEYLCFDVTAPADYQFVREWVR